MLIVTAYRGRIHVCIPSNFDRKDPIAFQWCAAKSSFLHDHSNFYLIVHSVHQTLFDDIHNRYCHDTALPTFSASGQVCMSSMETYLVVFFFRVTGKKLDS